MIGIIKLGSKVRDKVTGFTGIVTTRVEHHNGCIHYGVIGPVNKDGKLENSEFFDIGNLEVLDEELVSQFIDADMLEDVQPMTPTPAPVSEAPKQEGKPTGGPAGRYAPLMPR